MLLDRFPCAIMALKFTKFHAPPCHLMPNLRKRLSFNLLALDARRLAPKLVLQTWNFINYMKLPSGCVEFGRRLK